jgi:plastocyanin
LSGTGLFWALILFTLMLLAVAVSIFGTKPVDDSMVSGTDTPTPLESREPRLYTVSYKGGVFSPTNLRIHSGDTVRFRNDSFFPIHIIGDGKQLPGFDSVGDVPQGSYFAFTFAAKGIFGYHNEKAPDQVGTIIVR